MPKSIKIYITFLSLILVGIIWIDATRPKPINWRETFEIKDKIPFGLYILNNEINSFFSPQKIEKYPLSPYQFIEEYNEKITTSGTILYINSKFEIDEESVQKMLQFTEQGNTLFLSSNSFPYSFLKRLNIRTKTAFNYNDSIQFIISQQNYKTPNYYNKGIYHKYFDLNEIIISGGFSEKHTTEEGIPVIGHFLESSEPKEGRPNFIKVKYGKGNIFLHLHPIVFTNYYLLKNSNYAAKVLSYIPDNETVLWKIKPYNNSLSQSPMRFFLSQPSLKWAWYIALLGILFFIFFNAKRKQRIIPIITPLKNTTIAFVKTIGNLYYQEKNYKDITHKKIVYFLEKIRTKYLINTQQLNTTFTTKLHQKTGKNKKEITALITLIKQLQKATKVTEANVIELNKKIENLDL